jgi:hypothetical protein
MDQLRGFLVVNGGNFGVVGPEGLIFGSGKYPDDLEPVLGGLRGKGVEVEGLGPVSGVTSNSAVLAEEECFC